MFKQITIPNRLRFNLVWFVLLFSLSGFVALLNPASQRAPVADDLAIYPWIYLRDGNAPDTSNSVSLIAVGDVMLGRGISENRHIFERVMPFLLNSDFLIGNFEGAILSPGEDFSNKAYETNSNPIHLFLPPALPAMLQEAGFDLLSLANNHSLDMGNEGLKETADRLQKVGISIVGAQSTISGAYKPVYRSFKGVKIAFLAFNAVSNPEQPGLRNQPITGYYLANWYDDAVTNAIKTARSHSDVVIVSIHWGYEYDRQPNWWQEEKAKLMVDAGADLVLGHHPHVVQSTQVFSSNKEGAIQKDSLVAYSLGNFVFDQYEEYTNQGLALRVLLDKGGLLGVQALPVWTVPRPRLMSTDEMERTIEIAQPAPKRIGFSCNTKGCVQVEISQEPRKGIFEEGCIDLTGDGRPELMLRNETRRLEAQGGENDENQARVTILQDGSQVWQSPSQWDVFDLALGDPNDDGRYELMLALQRPDRDGVVHSHPFIIGFRGGSYKDVWGGSAVADPIRELELGDLDGDNIQELVVLEERGNESRQAVTVWRWNGWGFSLEWRSPEGRYKDLVLLPGEDGKFFISVGEIW